ncbi:MAG: hypothetical protein J1E33_06315 [Alistipes sp.]|nr:hypothetical protein [Alistipes sp.]
MKTIEERAVEFVNILMSENECSDLLRELLKETYIAAATDERALLTEWHDPKEPPKEGAELLLKILMPVDEGDIRTYAVGDYIRNEFIMPNTYAGAKVLGWRYIHEND